MSVVSGWTDSRYWGYIRSMLRKGFSRFPNKYKCLAASKTGRNQYTCADCGKTHGKKDVSVDHIIPCGALKGYDDVSVFVYRMFCGMEGLQVLCKACHYTKTMHERGMTDDDILVAKFRKHKAADQKRILIMLGVRSVNVGTNSERRIKQYRRRL